MKNIFNLILLVVVASVVGCSPKMGTDPYVSKSGFDGATVVSIRGHGNLCRKSCTGLGAQWNSKTPKDVILTVHVYLDYTGISGADLMIDGKKYSLAPTISVTDIDYAFGVKESSKGFEASLAVIEKITKSKNAWLRVYTPTGYMEDAIIDNGEDSKAYNALKRFLKEVSIR